MGYIKYAYFALVGWGLWAIGAKVLTRYLNPISVSFWISFWTVIFLSLFILVRKNLVFNKYVLLAIPVGLVSFLAIFTFYIALKKGPASVVVPLTNLYVLFPVFFGFIILHESITITRIAGIACAILAAILLSL